MCGKNGLHPMLTKSATAAADGNNDTDPSSWSNSLFLGLFELASVSEGDSYKPGLSISWELGKSQFLSFILCNSMCFFLSIATIVVVALTEIFLWDWQCTSLLLLPMMCILLLISAAEFVFGVAIVTDTSVANVFPLRALIMVVILLNLIWQIAWTYQYLRKRLQRWIEPFTDQNHYVHIIHVFCSSSFCVSGY